MQNISHQKIYTFGYCVVSDEVQYTSTQIYEQIKEVVLPRISKLNDSALDKKLGNQIQFFPKKTLGKLKIFVIQ